MSGAPVRPINGWCPMNQISEKPVVFAKFQGQEILGELGRYMFSLLNAFSGAGHPIMLFDNLSTGQMGIYALEARSLNNLQLTQAAPDSTIDKIYLFDIEDKKLAKRRWEKKIQIKFDVFAPYWLRRPVLKPFPIHPVHVGPDLDDRLARFRTSPRCMRVFFSGDMEGYTRNRINYPGPKLPRAEVIKAVRERLGDKVLFVQDRETLDRVLACGYTEKCVILDTSKLRVPDGEWLGVLSKADFFLAPPGIVMPMCHNAVEAMAVGTVPIINYPEWFDPNLENMRNCVAFGDAQSLCEQLAIVFAMGHEQLAAMHASAISYYEAHLSDQSFVTEIEARPERKIDVLMITERYVAANADRLNGRSVLLRGATTKGAAGWFRRLIQS